MNLSEFIAKLEEIRKLEGDLKVCVTENHEYWGTLYYEIPDCGIEVTDHAQPEGPKSGRSERAVVLSNGF